MVSAIHFDIITLFPEFFQNPLKTSLFGKAIEKNLVSVNLYNLRSFGEGKSKSVDDKPYGGGPGMVIKVNVLVKALEEVILQGKKSGLSNPLIILLDPAGDKLSADLCQKYSRKDWIIIVSGHYEGVDQRFKDYYADQQISIGDYVLSGGEPAALVLMDAISRLVPGFVGKEQSVKTESFERQKVAGKSKKLLDFPVYTRPENFRDKKVPDVLLSGDHKKINSWRFESSVQLTNKKRPDLLD